MKLHWIYPKDTQSDWYSPNEPHRVAILAELWNAETGTRGAIITRSNEWPDTDYLITVLKGRDSDERIKRDSIKLSGSFTEAQTTAIALFQLNN